MENKGWEQYKNDLEKIHGKKFTPKIEYWCRYTWKDAQLFDSAEIKALKKELAEAKDIIEHLMNIGSEDEKGANQLYDKAKAFLDKGK